MRLLACFVLSWLFIGGGCGDLVEARYEGSDQTWHDRFVGDSCERCPECCTGPIEE